MLTREKDIKQSDSWGSYLSQLGWKIKTTSSGIKIAVRYIGRFGFTKIQHPASFSKNDILEIEKICRDNKCLYIKIEPDFNQDMSVFDGLHYERSSTANSSPSVIWVDLNHDEKDLWGRLSSSARNSVNRSRRAGFYVRISEMPSDDIIQKLHALLIETGAAKHFYVEPANEVTARIRAFGDQAAIAFVYNSQNEIQAAKLLLGYNDIVTYDVGGMKNKARNNRSGYLLVWEVMMFAKSRGYKIFDLGGVHDKRFSAFTRNWEGFSHFKEMFGGEKIEFPEPRIKYLSKILRLVTSVAGTNL